ncbi:hypothetical protein N9969_03040 [Akkermansiaceae bacterium]|nr:hypothetical protein [Akkermansiaceae bacterium]
MDKRKDWCVFRRSFRRKVFLFLRLGHFLGRGKKSRGRFFLSFFDFFTLRIEKLSATENLFDTTFLGDGIDWIIFT